MVKDTGTAYILWLGCCIGLCGLHRFYLDNPILGIIYLCTGGLFGIGQLIDLILIPGIVTGINNSQNGGNHNNVVIQNSNVQAPPQYTQPVMQPYVQQPVMQQPVYVQQPMQQQPVYVQQPVMQQIPPQGYVQPVVQPLQAVAYILWLGCCIGLCGLHRFYLDSPLLGIIYLCTGGLFGIGQLLDLFFIPSIVSSLNKGGNNVVIQNTNVQNPGLGMGVGMVAGAMMQQSMQQQQPMMMQQPMMQQPMMMQQPVYVQQPVMQQPVVQPPVQQQPPVQVIVESKQ